MFCPRCGKQSAADANFCSACGASSVPAPAPFQQNRIVRPRHPRMIAGVCSGLAIHYGWDVALVRILVAVAACVTGGMVFLAYLVAWVVLPDAQFALPPVQPYYGPYAVQTTQGPGSAV